MRLLLHPNTDTQQTIDVSGNVATVGRAADNTIVLACPDVADYHVRLQFEDGEWTAVDLARRGDVTVDGRQGWKLPVKDGSRICLGAEEMLVVSPSDARDEAISLTPSVEAENHEVTHSVAVAKQCQGCGFLTHETSRFCPRCGSSFAAAPVLAVPPEGTTEPSIAPWLALIFSVCGPIVLGIGWLLGGVLAVISLSRTRRISRSGRHAAWWAIVLSVAWIILMGAGIGWLAWNFSTDVRVVRNEANAENLLRGIAISEYYVKYAEAYDSDGDDVGEYVHFPKLQAVNYHLMDRDLGDTPLHHGYFFTIKRADESNFICTAFPRKYGVTGRNSFWVDDRGEIHREDLRGKDFDRSPITVSDQKHKARILDEVSDELAGDLGRAAESAFKNGQYEKCKRIIDNVRSLFPQSAAAQRLTALEQSSNPFLIEFKSKEQYQRAEDLLNGNQLDAAIETLRTIVRNFPSASIVSKTNEKIAELTESRAREHLKLAEQHFRDNQADKALGVLRDIGIKYPEAALAANLKDRIAACETEVMKMLEQEASKLYGEARALEAAGEYEKAYSVYLSVKNRYGKTQVARGIDETLGKIRKMIEESEAGKFIDEIFQLSPEQNASRINSLLDLLKRGYARTEVYQKNQDVLISLQHACRAHQYVTAARQQLADKSYRAALANLKLAVDEDPSIAITMLSEFKRCYLRLGDAAFENQDYTQALDYYQRYLKLQPKKSKLNVKRLMECNYQIAKIEIQNRNFTATEEHLLTCAKQYGRDPEYNFLHGQALMNMGRWEDAAECFARTLSADPTYSREARLYKAYCLYRFALGEEEVLHVTIMQDSDFDRLIKDYEILFNPAERTSLVSRTQQPLVKPSDGKPFSELAADVCTHLELLSTAAERLTGLPKSQKEEKLQQRAKFAALSKTFPTS